MAKVMLLAAGRGTRLTALTGELPKPLVPVGDRPILRHILDTLAAHGIEQVVANTHHLAAKFDDFDAGAVELLRAHEPKLRGTAGGIFGAKPMLDEHCLVWNSDIFTEPPVDDLLHLANVAPLTLLVTAADRPPGEGTVGVARDGRVARLRGEKFGTEVRGADYVGLAALGAEVLSELPAFGCLVGDVCLPRLRRGLEVNTLSFDGPWTDIGTLDAYLELNLEWLRRRALSSWASETAQVSAGIRVEESIIGAGAAVAGDGKVRRSVIWPGATVCAPVQNEVVLQSGERVSC